MASSSSKQHYPDYLNPFGSDEVNESESQIPDNKIRQDEYPDHLSPFGEDEPDETASQLLPKIDDYDDSLNPFGLGEDETEDKKDKDAAQLSISSNPKHGDSGRDGNPFDEDDQKEENLEKQNTAIEEKQVRILPAPEISASQPESSEPPPVPLPRTKSLLKKEQALRAKQQQQKIVADSSHPSSSEHHTISSSPIAKANAVSDNNATANGSFQRKKNKRNAPPVPINFKRQVLGSLDAIEEELNDIGDKLAIIEKESNLCQQSLKDKNLDKEDVETSRSKFVELIKRKHSIVRRQKELMYRKREMKLDQIHSDIEYELRMIGNKQVSHRTAEDELKEKDLLKKLVEIVEEKSDIVENLNKDTTANDDQEIEDALRKLDISDSACAKSATKEQHKITTKDSNKDCDTGSIAIGAKFSKLATLLPKSGTIKGTMKIKRKRLFKKGESRSIER